MAQILGLPKLSPTMEEGVLVRWTKKEGDKVSPGDLIAEVETDKANMDFNVEDEGTLLKLLVKEGDTVKLGAPVAIIGKPGEDTSALEAQAKSGGGGGDKAPAKKDEAPKKEEPKKAEATPAAKKDDEAKPAAKKDDAKPAATKADATVKAAPKTVVDTKTPSKILASPLAKSLAIEVTLQPGEKSFTDEELKAVADKVVAAAEKLGASLRG